MAVVSNAGPLIALARIGRLDLLPALFGQVVVPPSVFEEITDDASRPGAVELREAPWVAVRAAADELLLQRLRSGSVVQKAKPLFSPWR